MVYEIYTDGSTITNPGIGGYAAIVYPDKKEYTGRSTNTTNNRMELTAAIVGLNKVPPGSHIILYSDSEYVVHALKKKRLQKWIDECTISTRVNSDLWGELVNAVVRHENVEFRWVPGHSSNKYNEYADTLAKRAARRSRG